MIVFTVEFTEKAPEKGRLAFHPNPLGNAYVEGPGGEPGGTAPLPRD